MAFVAGGFEVFGMSLANLRNKALAEPVRREVPGPDPLGGGLRATNEGVREDSLGVTLRREGPLGTDCGAKRGATPLAWRH